MLRRQGESDVELDKAHRLLAPRLVVVIGSTNSQGEANVMPASNVTSICTEPEIVGISVYREWTTCANLLDAGGWTLSLPSMDQLALVWKLGGRYSGYARGSGLRKTDEFAEELDFHFSAFGPVLQDGIASFECEKIRVIGELGDHVLFLGLIRRAVGNPRYYGTDAEILEEPHGVMQWSRNRFSTSDGSRFIDYHE